MASLCGVEKNPDFAGEGGFAVEKQPDSRSRQVCEFRDTFGHFVPYRRAWYVETNPLYDPSDNCEDSEEEEEARNFPDLRQRLIKHIQQVRQSFGFDVDVHVPDWTGVNYYPIGLSKPANRRKLTEVANVAVDGINADMNKKMFELVEVLKGVYNSEWSINLTFTAKKVDAAEANSVVTIQAIVLINPPNFEL